ncbi:MAG TPA: hypothetical protein VJT71_09275 [Pyrinomonadaceae bacterium]|nr:hypothetical protein [Pyrinomonadaceae bacterium]
MKIKQITLLAILMACCLSFLSPANAGARGRSDESDVRGTVQRVFDQLKTGQYGALYDGLPSASRSRISRDRFVSGLQRAQEVFRLDRIEIGAVRVAGDLAVVDTTMYAHVSKPLDADGKLVVQQYLIREQGQWRVVTGDNATVNRFLKANPAFARKFPIKRPSAFIKQNGKWVAMPMGRR